MNLKKKRYLTITEKFVATHIHKDNIESTYLIIVHTLRAGHIVDHVIEGDQGRSKLLHIITLGCTDGFSQTQTLTKRHYGHQGLKGHWSSLLHPPLCTYLV